MKSNENLKGAFELGRAFGIGSRLCLVDLGDQLLDLSSIVWLIGYQCFCSELFDLSQHFWSAACFGWY
jgi:hypothetical protein